MVWNALYVQQVTTVHANLCYLQHGSGVVFVENNVGRMWLHSLYLCVQTMMEWLICENAGGLRRTMFCVSNIVSIRRISILGPRRCRLAAWHAASKALRYTGCSTALCKVADELLQQCKTNTILDARVPEVYTGHPPYAAICARWVRFDNLRQARTLAFKWTGSLCSASQSLYISGTRTRDKPSRTQASAFQKSCQ